MFNWYRKKKYQDYEINPDEIFLDDLNVSGLDKQQFEGVIEKPIPKRNLFMLFGFFALVVIIFCVQLFSLQIRSGDTFLAQSEDNRLRDVPLFAQRGIVYDRNGVELAWNIEGDDEQEFSFREYTLLEGHGHVLGYVQYPQKDDRGFYWRDGIIGQAGIEQRYNDELSGSNGAFLVEVDALGDVVSKNSIRVPEDGTNIHTTLDAHVQDALYRGLAQEARDGGFQGAAASIMSVENGDLLAFTSYPEYSPNILAEGSDVEAIEGFFNDPQKPFLNRVTNGLYSPGSTIKPFLGLAALHEDIITAQTRIFSVGFIEVPNPFNPGNSSIFKDWRPEGHGSTDIRHAIADSVNTFFYAIGGGYKNQKGLGISRIENYTRMFGISEKTGIDFGTEIEGTIPGPAWKEATFDDGTWRLGDTYITSLGQFGFQVTPLQMTRAVGALANGGRLLTPRLIDGDQEPESVSEGIGNEDYELIRLAMRDTVTKGTAQAVNISELAIAAKTGTAQVGANNEFYHSWIVGFFPYDEPEYSFAIVMERAKRGGVGSASRAMRTFLDHLREDYPEFFETE